MTKNTTTSLPKNRVLHGDCIDLMRGLPSESVDFVLTDPPYIVRYTSRDGRKIAGDDTTDWIKPAFEQVYRLLKPDSYVVSFYGWNAVEHFMRGWKHAGFVPVSHFVWHKRYASKSGFTRAHHENAYLLAKGNPPKPDKPLSDVLPWRYSGNSYHPTQKPVMALLPLVETFCPPGGIVLDPFAGSASTAVAAKKCGRNFLCIEKDGTYYGIARRRLGLTDDA